MAVKSLRLRAHHLLCLQGFNGKGYNDTFTLNMAEIYQYLQRKPQTKVKLGIDLDDLCSSCPHASATTCQKDNLANERMQERDNALLKIMKLNKNHADSFLNLTSEAKKIFTTVASVQAICFDCLWQKDCLFYQSINHSAASNRV